MAHLNYNFFENIIRLLLLLITRKMLKLREDIYQYMIHQ